MVFNLSVWFGYGIMVLLLWVWSIHEIEIKIDRKHIDLQALITISICYLQALTVVSTWYFDE